MTGFALYRLPYEGQVTLVAQKEGEPLELPSIAALNGQTGFVVAPFSISPSCPLVLIRPDVVQTFPSYRECVFVGAGLSQAVRRPLSSGETTSLNRDTYADDFRRFFAGLSDGRFSKLVLSRCAEVQSDEDAQPLTLFQRACEMYPRMFISLVYTPQSGMWLTATPEILLEGIGNQWRTIALAGTMKLRKEQLAFDNPPQSAWARGDEQANIAWSTKNIQEQRYVATYMVETLEHFSTDITEDGPYTARAGHLVHLRSDFSFTLPDTKHLGSLLKALHPTPAVCGLPKREAFKFISRNEYAPRRYYSVFMGPLRLASASEESGAESTHLFVSLRCMEILGNHYKLHAGGGLLRDSNEQQEWNETEAKLETMRSLL
jgi:isochorismate synthase